MEIVWKIYVVKTKIEIRECIEKMLGEEGGQPSQFQGRVIFMSMYSIVFGGTLKKKKQGVC